MAASSPLGTSPWVSTVRLPPRFWRPFVANHAQHLMGRDHHEQPPKIVAITKTRIATRLDSAENAMYRTQGNVFLIGCPQWPATELVSGKLHKAMKVLLPQVLGRLAIAAL